MTESCYSVTKIFSTFSLLTALTLNFFSDFRCVKLFWEEVSEISGTFRHLDGLKRGVFSLEIFRFYHVLQRFPFFQSYDVDSEEVHRPTSSSAGVSGTQYAAPCPGGVFLLPYLHGSSAGSIFCRFLFGHSCLASHT
jgi:hypothetical protein